MTIPVGSVRVEPLNVATAGVLALIGICTSDFAVSNHKISLCGAVRSADFGADGVARPSHRVGLTIVFLFGMLFTNGVSSMAAHATVYQGLGFMDSMSEVVMVMIGTLFLIDISLV